jgi:6-phosphogluconolactonase
MAKFYKIIKKSNENLLISNFIEIFKDKLSNKLKSSKRFTFVLTGGDSPIKLYKKLQITKNIPWKKIDFFIGDERYVKENSKYSNFNMCKKYLLSKINITNRQIFKISKTNGLISNDADFYEKKIKNYFIDRKVSFDITLLGVGEDGHIASLFKNNINTKTNKIVNFIKMNDFFRITLTINYINKSNAIMLWAPGKSKKKIVKKIILDKFFKYPASYLKKKNTFLFYCN